MSELRPERYQQIYELFSRVVMIEEDGARLAEIDRVCVDDPALRDHVLLLLGASAEAEEGSGLFTERGVDSVRAALVANFEAQPAAGAAHTIPDEIGGYRVLRRIGQGGMGVVYEAEQRQPKRRVALKVVEGVRGGTELAARLRHEAEIQGNLHHPGIAQVFEAGVATIGLSQCPFFAMELVEGRSILAFADDADLPLRKRLELLASVADGVGYAHERGVVHRDLKPENILVKPNGQPKVLDFGIASVTGDATFAATSITRDGQILGTLAYMAPEQLGHREDVTPRADVYALGVIAFELLAGRPPIDLGGLSISAAIREIELRNPPALTMVNRSIPRDVGTIVGQCLDRDPSRRYSDGNALATDIRRFLDERPIRARAPSVVYRAAKFARRNRALVGGVLATVLTLLIGVVVAGGFASGQYRARLAAEASDREARRQQTRLASFTFQSAADHSMSGNTLASIEQLELIPAGVRGWGWDLLAASVPLWMPGTAGFGGVAFNRHAGTAWTGNRTFVLVNDGKQVLTIIDGSLVTWDPWSGETSAHPELGRFVRVEDVPHTPLPVALVFGEDERPGVLDTKEWRILPAEEGTERLPVPWRVEPSSGALLWQEDEADGAGSRGAGGTASYLATRSHGHRRLELGSDAGTQLPGWVDVRNLDDRVVLSLYDERAEGLWCRLACVDAATGRVLARTERATESMAVVLLPERDEIATAAITYPERAPAGELLVYDAERLELRRRFDRIAQPLAYLPDRDRLVVRLENGEYRLMDLDDGRLDGGVLCRDLDRDNMGPLIHSNGVMHGGASVVAITDRPYRPLVIDTTEPQVGLRPSYHARPLPGALYHLAVSPHGGLLATMSPWHDEIAVLDARTGETLATRQMRSAGGHRWHAMLWFSPRGDALHATVEAADGSVVGVTSWSLAEGTSRSAIPERPSPMNSTVPRLVQESLPPGGSISARHAVTPGGDALLFTGSGENTIKRLDLAGHTFERLPIGTAEGIALSPDGRHLAAVASLGARIIDIETGEVVARPISDPDRLLSVAYSPDGSTLAVGSQDGRIFVVETEFYTLLYSFQSTPPEDGRGPLFVHDLRWSPDSRTLYAAHAGGVLTAWEARHPQERRARSQRQEDADRVASENLDAMLSRGLSVADAGQRLLSDRPLTPAQRAAGEVALVRRWAAGSDPE